MIIFPFNRDFQSKKIALYQALPSVTFIPSDSSVASPSCTHGQALLLMPWFPCIIKFLTTPYYVVFHSVFNIFRNLVTNVFPHQMRMAPLDSTLPTEIDENHVLEILTWIGHTLLTFSFLTCAFVAGRENCSNTHVI